ncbi:NUDIX hydrolase [Marinoscillum furvescens]|uniref:8-oxo-dGTP diphosphatase n=1 Tax=Marinoscillum furvescens DSM 4134 TaxID=1122208 RepID=A0A3D9KZ94_MARFU|nr:NUDIX domain-containing protein [Marinoscillum furvescens]RED93419.1 8-oxo-dGTP diphosphatase [Marinoscillum furvescens DSM 4134]
MKEKPISTVNESSYECTITVDCAIFGFQEDELKLLLVKRAVEPYKDFWLLPGGTMEEGKTVEEAMNRVLYSLTGIHGIHHEQVGCYSAVDRHPVKRAVTISFYALIKPENHPVIAKNYISDVKWYPLEEIPQLGFDHDQIFKDALVKLRENLQRKLLFGELLPEKFTLKELQDLYESILGETLDRRNFRKKMLQMELLQPTNEKKAGVRGGPELYRIKK